MVIKVPYSTGYRVEREAKQMLESEGFFVLRSAGSHGLFDLVAIKDNQVRLVQVKVIPFGEHNLFKADQLKIKAFKVAYWIKKELWVYEKRRGWHYYQV